jgi:hypothetical protein
VVFQYGCKIYSFAVSSLDNSLAWNIIDLTPTQKM